MPHLSKARSNPLVIGGCSRIRRIFRLSCCGVILSKYATEERAARCLSQQLRNDAEPFRIERFTTDGLPRPAVPVRCIALVAFLAMQVGVNP
jgi:hypothetical protein